MVDEFLWNIWKKKETGFLTFDKTAPTYGATWYRFLNLHCLTCNVLLPVVPSTNEWIQGRELFAFWKLNINRVAYANKVEKSIKGEIDQFSFWKEQFVINDRYMYNVSGEYYRYRFRNLWFYQVSVNCFIDWFSTWAFSGNILCYKFLNILRSFLTWFKVVML